MARVQSKNELMVIEKIDLIEYFNKIVVPINKKFKPMSPANTTAICPFHTDTDPSLHYWKSKGIYHCFGCGYGGDVVKTHNQIRRQYFGENMTIESTVNQLASLFDIELDIETGYIVKSVFERAKESMFDQATYAIPKDVLSLAEYRQLNNRVKTSNAPIRSKITNFEHLDLVASVTLGNK